MSITQNNISRAGDLATVEVESDLTAPVYFHWYIDGEHIAETASGRMTFHVPSGEQLRLTVQDTTDPDYDAVANAPDGYPARRLLNWTRSIDADVGHYRIEQKLGAGAWTILDRVLSEPGRWEYSYRTGRLDDLGSYQFKIVPVDAAGNDGTVVSIAAETIVRTPDAPEFTVSLDDATQKVTFAAA